MIFKSSGLSGVRSVNQDQVERVKVAVFSDWVGHSLSPLSIIDTRDRSQEPVGSCMRSRADSRLGM